MDELTIEIVMYLIDRYGISLSEAIELLSDEYIAEDG